MFFIVLGKQFIKLEIQSKEVNAEITLQRRAIKFEKLFQVEFSS